ncbi:MAG: hypothetical protein QF711_00060 [SAR324 cluster bacterium]|nr:hypothetical protein [SAR324 cluster bacterium]
MRHKCSAFLERNTEVPEVKSALHSIKILTESKNFFLKRLSFETEPAGFAKVLNAKNGIQPVKEELHGR